MTFPTPRGAAGQNLESIGRKSSVQPT